VAARLAGQTALEESSFLKVSVKNNSELLTQADQRCQQIIIDQIKHSYPDHGFLAEEGEAGGIFRQPPRSGDFWWIIDPIDGTNNYARGIPIYASASVYCWKRAHSGRNLRPVNGFDVYNGQRRRGPAQFQKDNRSEDRIDMFSSIGIDSHFDKGVPGWISEIMTKTSSQPGLHITRDRLRSQRRTGGCGIQCTETLDIAAGAVIAEAAGAVVTDWQGKKLFPMDLTTIKAALSRRWWQTGRCINHLLK